MNHFEKVAVFMGGWSAEREVSLKSGQAVYDALRRKGINAHAIDVNRNIVEKLHTQGFTHVFNIMHGRGGEDGVIQALLELHQLPYTGSGVLGSALAMDKLKCKQLWTGIGLPTPAHMELNSEADCINAVEKLGLPLMIKPVLEGSSIGISKVTRADDMVKAWKAARECVGTVIAEAFVTGEEYTAAILDNQVLPMIRLKTDHDFYDYQAKYVSDDTQYICPCGLQPETETELGAMMLQAFNAIGLQGWGRVDFMLDAQQQPWLIEVNTVPGMTDHSLVPMAARQAGIEFDDLVLKILQGAKLNG